MERNTPEILSANLVLVGVDLLATPDALNRFREANDPDLRVQQGMSTEIPSGITEPSRTVELGRERIVLELSASRSSITKEYPVESDLERLTEIVTFAINASGAGEKNPRAFGYNVELVHNPNTGEAASPYIGRVLFGKQPLGKENWELSGGNGQIIFNDLSYDRQWTVNIRPRSNEARDSRVFVGLNLHYDEQEMPSREAIISSLKELWNEAHEFVSRLG